MSIKSLIPVINSFLPMSYGESRNEKYKDVLDYIHSVGCDYYFEYIPLHRLGLPVPPELVED